MYRIVAITFLSVIVVNIQASEMSSDELRYICRDLTYNTNAFDYQDSDAYIQREIRNIEKHHFNSKVRNGIGGQTGYLIADLAFIFRSVPNHHLALGVLGNYYLAGGPSHGHAPADCYFRLAQSFQPNDGNVALIYGIFLAKSDRVVEAERQYKLAIQRLTEPAEAHYDLALLYLERGNNEQALEHAKVAYDRGYPLPGLKKKLRKLGFDFE